MANPDKNIPKIRGERLDELKRDYELNIMSQTQLSELYEVNRAVIDKLAKRHGWVKADKEKVEETKVLVEKVQQGIAKIADVTGQSVEEAKVTVDYIAKMRDKLEKKLHKQAKCLIEKGDEILEKGVSHIVTKDGVVELPLQARDLEKVGSLNVKMYEGYFKSKQDVVINNNATVNLANMLSDAVKSNRQTLQNPDNIVLA